MIFTEALEYDGLPSGSGNICSKHDGPKVRPPPSLALWKPCEIQDRLEGARVDRRLLASP